MNKPWNNLTPEQKQIATEYHRAVRLANWLRYLFNDLPLPLTLEGTGDEGDTIPPPPPPPPPPPF